MEWFDVAVESGRTVEVGAELAPCASGPIGVYLPAEEHGQARVELTLIDSEGRVRVRLKHPAAEAGSPPGHVQIPLQLPIGRYRYSARLLGTARKAAGVLDIDSFEERESLGAIEL